MFWAGNRQGAVLVGKTCRVTSGVGYKTNGAHTLLVQSWLVFLLVAQSAAPGGPTLTFGRLLGLILAVFIGIWTAGGERQKDIRG